MKIKVPSSGSSCSETRTWSVEEPSLTLCLTATFASHLDGDTLGTFWTQEKRRGRKKEEKKNKCKMKESDGWLTTQASESGRKYDDDSAFASPGNPNHHVHLQTESHRLHSHTPFSIHLSQRPTGILHCTDVPMNEWMFSTVRVLSLLTN